MAKMRQREPLVWGIILIIIGVIFILYNINLDVWKYVAKLWPLILVAWGGWKLYFGIAERQDRTKPK